MRRSKLVGVLSGLVLSTTLLWLFADDKGAPPDRKKVEQNLKKGNWKEAFEGYRALLLDPNAEASRMPDDLNFAVQSMRNLGTSEEFDPLVEDAVKAHPKSWQLLAAAANQYENNGEPYGYIVAGKFSRGQARGGEVRYVSTMDRDHVRALQLLQQAMPLLDDADATPQQKADVFVQTANTVMGRNGYNGAWRLQALSDISQLPDYVEGWYGYGYDQGKGAPADAAGNPIFHAVPAGWDKAKSDGERWRWCLQAAAKADPARTPEIRFLFAQFLRFQFDVQTVASYGWLARFDEEEGTSEKDQTSAAFSVRTLTDKETLARLATGVKRFELPDEFNFIRIFRDLGTAQADTYGEQSLTMLAQIYEDRRQYPHAAEIWKELIKKFGDPGNGRKQRLDQIEGNWGQFDPSQTQPAGRGASVGFKYRNGSKVELEAFEIDIKRLLADVKDKLLSNPPQLDWNDTDVSNIGYRIVTRNQKRYLKDSVAKWSIDLNPRLEHLDRHMNITTPLQKAGAYLLVSKMEDGNTSRIVMWVADTVVVKRPLDMKTWFFVADAVTGKPIAHANLECFGFRQRYVQGPNQQNGHYVIDTLDFAEFTDDDGQVVLDGKDRNEYTWLISATTEGQDARFAYLGFTGFWYQQAYDAEYNQVKLFGITDRPVYRPSHTVKFKVWVEHAKYDEQGKSPYAGQSFAVQITDPKGDKIWEKSLTADGYGGIQAEYPLAADAALGMYAVTLPTIGQGTSFRVEEYKKPEFEVKVDAPTEPVMLGEKVTATIQAKYLFGAPVNEGKVHYKIMRTSYSANWYPRWYWDWFYGPGAWWYACDYGWYPGWREWGCCRPGCWWWDWVQPEQPEMVADVESAIGADGVVKVEIDTAVAKAIHGDQDHQYTITAEVTDPSRRTIVGTGNVLVSRKPFKVYAWVDSGWYRAGDTIHASFQAQRLDGKPVKGKGALKMFSITYEKGGKPLEAEVQKWDLDTDDQGSSVQTIEAAQAGQYRLSYTVTDAANHAIEGGYVFTVVGDGFHHGADFRFNALELIPDKREYAPGEAVKLQINVDQVGGTVLLFDRPANGVYRKPKVIRLEGKSASEEIAVALRDMPNFFVEAMTVCDGKVESESREILVPPTSRVLDVTLTPSGEKFKPGQKAKAKVKLTDPAGKPFKGSVVVAVYDKAVEYISGGSNVPAIREFFWKWRRSHHVNLEHSLAIWGQVALKENEPGMSTIGVFGAAAEGADAGDLQEANSDGFERKEKSMLAAKAPGAPAASGGLAQRGRMAGESAGAAPADRDEAGGGGGAPPPPPGPAMVQPTVRSNFADTALWVAAVETDDNGETEVEWTMPESLTTWKTKVWAMGAGTQVGEASADLITTKDVIVRLQAPRFFVQKDEVVLSANVHNYLKAKKSVQVTLALDGGCLEAMGDLTQTIEVDPEAQKRVDWRVKVTHEGTATVRASALTDEESDAMEMKFPVYVHGMLKTDSYSGVVRPEQEMGAITIRVPKERRPDQSRLELRYSPTLAGAMVDALPYLTDYPYGCTEQTLNRFLPTVITQNILLKMGLDLKDIEAKRTNLNAQEIGDDKKRAEDWARVKSNHNPVFDIDEVKLMVKTSVNRLTSMQCADGGWGWFSGWGEQSWPHTTAYVVHGLQIARENDVALVPGVLERGVAWLKSYQAREVQRLKLPSDAPYHKDSADALDAFVYMVLVDEKSENGEMRDFLFRDKNHLPVYAKAMFGLALHTVGQTEKLAEVRQNLDQFLVNDDEDQTAYLRLPEDNWWWCWWGSEYEAQAYYLKLLCRMDPKGETASRMVKYLVNNRKHATYWNSTRDTATCIEAFADYMKASGEEMPDMTVQITVDGKQAKEVKISRENLFSFDNKLVMTGAELTDGEHKIEVHRVGKGSVYFNAYLTNFTLEDPIGPAGLEVKVARKFYRLVPVDKTEKSEGGHGQVVDQKVEKYKREELADGADLKSGDLVEVELTIDSKNDYEYLLFEDMKAAGFEPVEVRSGYNGNEMGAYVEYHDERVAFFVRVLPRGQRSISYRLRAEIPGKFSALPTRASAMYAPELKANSAEMKLGVHD